MQLALSLAAEGIGKVNPNPLVGAVIVSNGKVIGKGYHRLYGGPHAEIDALNSTTENVKGATMYVTLEPCSHYGKTPPCADAIIASGISRVAIAMADPNPLVAGQGIEALKKNGIDVSIGICRPEAEEMNRVFIKYILTGKPYIVLKAAMSLDGKIATRDRHSKWISSEESRKRVQLLRNELKGIMIGVDSIISDNPRLTSRPENGTARNPVRIIVDSRGRIPVSAEVLKNPADNPVILATTNQCNEQTKKQLQQAGHKVLVVPATDNHVNLQALSIELGKLGIDGILLEGGGTLNEAALRAGIVDEVQFFIAPLLIGGKNAITPVEGNGFSAIEEAIRLTDFKTIQVGPDFLVTGRIINPIIA